MLLSRDSVALGSVLLANEGGGGGTSVNICDQETSLDVTYDQTDCSKTE